MIAPHAVIEFLERDLHDAHFIKDQMPAVGIDNAINELDPPFVTPPYAHQKACFLAGVYMPRLLFFLWMGTGKTKIVLDLLAHHWRTGKITKRALVLVPNDANVEAWRAEAEIHQPTFAVAQLPLNRTIPAGTQVAVCTYKRLTRLLTNTVVGRGSKSRWVVDRQRLERFANNFDAVVFDESTALMNPDSLITRIAVGISWRCKVAYGLTGTPFGRDPQALFSQFLAVDQGASFGANIGMFRAAFFDEKKDYWKGKTYALRANAEPDLRRAMRHRSIHYDLDECLTLPPTVENTVTVELGEQAAQLYFNHADAMRQGAVEGEDVRTSFIRLRQIATGYAVVDDDLDRTEIAFDDNVKLDALEELVGRVDPASKIVIFNDFIWSGAAICARLEKMGVRHLRLYGGTEDKGGAMRKFVDDDTYRVFVCNSQSGALGLNLQVANYVIFYESPVSPIVREQAKARCRRAGQTNTVFYYDIITRNTVEEKILEWVKEGRDLLDAVMSGEVVV